MDYVKRFAERVWAARERSGLTQDLMADALGCGRSAYRHYESDPEKPKDRHTKMPHHLMQKFCEITKVRKEWLIDGTEPMTGGDLPPKLQELFDNYNSVDETLKDAILEVSRTLAKRSSPVE